LKINCFPIPAIKNPFSEIDINNPHTGRFIIPNHLVNLKGYSEPLLDEAK